MDEGRLAAMLGDAAAWAASPHLHHRRAAALLVVDYYELAFRQAREILHPKKKHPDNIGLLYASALGEIPRLADLTFLQGLSHFRNRLAHDALHDPGRRTLLTFLDGASAARAAILEGAEESRQVRASLTEMGQRLVDAANRLAPLLGWHSVPPDEWGPVVDRARALGADKSSKLSLAHVDLLVRIHEKLATAEPEWHAFLDGLPEEPDKEEDEEDGQEVDPNGETLPPDVVEAGDYGAGHDYDKDPKEDEEGGWRDDPDEPFPA